MKLPKKILVPTDMSTFSLAALQYAEIIAEVFAAEITLIHIIHNGAGKGPVHPEDEIGEGKNVTVEESRR